MPFEHDKAARKNLYRVQGEIRENTLREEVTKHGGKKNKASTLIMRQFRKREARKRG